MVNAGLEAFARAMQALMDEGKVKIEEAGPASKRREYLVVAA